MDRTFPRRQSLELIIHKNRLETGRVAARDVAAAMRRYIQQKGKVVVVFAAAPSQNEFLDWLGRMRGVDWKRVVCFHLDEYVDLPRNHPNTFERYLRGRLFDRVRPQAVYYLKNLKGGPEKVARDYAKLLKEQGGLDLSCIGIGENGHIAFNEPGSDLEDFEVMRIITIDGRSVRQQFRDYKDHPDPAARYASLRAVPRRAWTMTVPAVLSAKEVYAVVPASQKAEAVKRMWEGPVSSSCPSSALRRHPFVRIYLDRDSASLLK